VRLKIGILTAAAAMLGVALFNRSAWAWGPGIHTVTALGVLSDLQSILPYIAEAIRAFPREFIYGCLAADFFVGKGVRSASRHPHNWDGGFAFLRGAGDDRERSFAYGFLSHLAADVVAHNIFVPEIIARQKERTLRGHVYAEILADYTVGAGYLRFARALLSQDLSECDHLIRTVSFEGGGRMKARKGLFKGGMRFSGYFFTTRDMLGGGKMDINTSNAISASVALSCEMVKDFLKRPFSAPCTMIDPMGPRSEGLIAHASDVWSKRALLFNRIKRYSYKWYQ